ncbi:universal stress protein [Heyndrickxia coagulans]|nr:universal stress protein [Heyndrickxia coagulans]
MKKILYATDGSNYSRYAAEITKSFLKIWPEAKLIVLYVTAKENYAYDLVPDAVERYEETVANQIKEEVENQLFAAWKEHASSLCIK